MGALADLVEPHREGMRRLIAIQRGAGVGDAAIRRQFRSALRQRIKEQGEEDARVGRDVEAVLALEWLRVFEEEMARP